ncbi:MAG: lipid-A-disaccharide synthase [Halobacteriovoraceae bacterium]|nr:lipid-A-disaccharide synthase [Halobacteriovoraceae bacterium]|tara:strand:- start:6539 stop:7666 length:1128 start_codon:yes stop_codon:yes gene_type:complete
MTRQSCLIIAGEKSGEDHAMTFLPQIMQQKPECDFYGVGGDKLSHLGVELLYHLKDFSGIGITEIVSKLPFYFKALDHILEEVEKRQTKTAILIDFQGFNLKLAKKLKKLNVEVLYYVAPQAWVWKPWRAKVLEQNVHTLFTILPFEKNWFQQRGVTKVKSVVHPLMIEHKENLGALVPFSALDLRKTTLKILLLPGSRNVEVSKLLPTFAAAVSQLKEKFDLEVGIVKSESVQSEHYQSASLSFDKEWKSEELKEALGWSHMAIAASGTVTLATGLYRVPTIVCYKVSKLTEIILKLFITYKGPASLTNIIHEKMLFPEFVQEEVTVDNIVTAASFWINHPQHYNELVSQLATTAQKLSGDDFSVSDYMSEVIS